MFSYIKKGWITAVNQPFAVVALFIYQLAWGLLLYRLVQSVVVPLLHRYPGAEQQVGAVRLFLAESQFQLFKTDLIHSYLWWLLGLLALRMLVSPFMNAGIYYSLFHPNLHSGYRFFKGMKQLALPFLFYYFIQMLLTLAPMYWMLPKAEHIVTHQSSYPSIILALLPWIAGYVLYGYLLHMCFMYVQFGKVSGAGHFPSLLLLLRYFLLIGTLSLVLILLSALLTIIALTVSYIWAGFLALLLYQLYPLFKMFFKMWAISTQFQLWSSKHS